MRRCRPPTFLSASTTTSLFLQKKKKLDDNSVDSRKIKNPTLRSFFDGAVDLGADAAGKAEKFWETLSK